MNEEYFIVYQPKGCKRTYLCIDSKLEQFYQSEDFSKAHAYTNKHIAYSQLPEGADWFILKLHTEETIITPADMELEQLELTKNELSARIDQYKTELASILNKINDLKFKLANKE